MRGEGRVLGGAGTLRHPDCQGYSLRESHAANQGTDRGGGRPFAFSDGYIRGLTSERLKLQCDYSAS